MSVQISDYSLSPAIDDCIVVTARFGEQSPRRVTAAGYDG